jgi:hypothetical protein
MFEKIVEAKKVLAEKLKDLRKKEKILLEKEKISENKKLIALGNLVVKAKIDHLNNEYLFGAFIEIAEYSKNPENLNRWKENRKNICTQNPEFKKNKITISFKKTIDPSLKIQLKNLGFKWNKFSGEYYGFGDKSEIVDLFKNQECSIQELKEFK